MSALTQENARQDSFKRQIISGAGYNAIAKYTGILISLVVSAVLARHLTPEDFGVVSVATVFIVFFSIFSDMGIGAAIIQNRNLDQEDISSIFSFTVFLSFILGGLFIIASPLIAWFYDNELLLHICMAFSLSIVFSTLNIVPGALINRDKQFKYLAMCGLIIGALMSVASIIAVLLGAGIYTLLIAPICSNILIFIANIHKYPQKFRLKLKITSLRKIARFSFYQFSFSFVNYFTRNLDKLIIGRSIGMTSLGFYDKSYRLMMMPIQNLTGVVSPVLHPILADYQDDPSLQLQKILSLIKVLAIIGFPLTPFLFFAAEDLILIVFGNQWIKAIPIFQILSLTVACQIIGCIQGPIFQSSNNTKLLFWVGNINTIVNIIGMLIAVLLFKTTVAVAWSIFITFSIGFIWNFWYIIYKVFDTSGKTLIKVLLPGIYSMLCLTVILILENQFLSAVIFKNGLWQCMFSLTMKTIPLMIAVYWTLIRYRVLNPRKFRFWHNNKHS